MGDVMDMSCDKGPVGLWVAFARAHAALSAALNRDLERAESVPLSWHQVLVQITHAGGRLRMQSLAELTMLTPSGITRLVDRMERDGLVVRVACPTDRRS